jgi:hypothetical protein
VLGLPSEDIALVVLLLCTSVAWLISGSDRDVLRWPLASIVGIALAGLCILLATGMVRPLAALHGLVGALMLPLVASAAGFWLGANLSQQIRRPSPVPVVVRLLFLLVLCFCCFSSTRTGYRGPSRLEPDGDWDNKLRFLVLHQVTIPAITGLLLVFWLGRLLIKAPQSAARDTSGNR